MKKLTDEEYSKVREVCLKEYLRRPYSRFWANGWCWCCAFLDHTQYTNEGYFNKNFLTKTRISQYLNSTKGRLILMKDVDTISVLSSIHTTKFLPLKALTVGRIMIIRENAEIKIRVLS